MYPAAVEPPAARADDCSSECSHPPTEVCTSPVDTDSQEEDPPEVKRWLAGSAARTAARISALLPEPPPILSLEDACNLDSFDRVQTHAALPPEASPPVACSKGAATLSLAAPFSMRQVLQATAPNDQAAAHIAPTSPHAQASHAAAASGSASTVDSPASMLSLPFPPPPPAVTHRGYKACGAVLARGQICKSPGAGGDIPCLRHWCRPHCPDEAQWPRHSVPNDPTASKRITDFESCISFAYFILRQSF